MAAAMKAGEKIRQAICILKPRLEYCVLLAFLCARG